MKRLASLDLLRGLAAFSVAVPHYLTLNEAGHRIADVVTISGVEVFFVLSGFVLAPQILLNVVGQPSRNLRTFLIRRWMRTIPAYLIALIFVAILTGQLLTSDFVRYAFYIQNLFSQANTNDFFPVAWSLSVEEWFYVTFAPLLFVVANILHRKDRKLAYIFAICFIITVVMARLVGDESNWDAEVRRVVIFRVDSIAWGFLLYLATQGVAPPDTSTTGGPALLGGAFAAFVVCGLIVGITAYHIADDPLSRQIFPFAAPAFGICAVFLFNQCEFLFAGRVSHSIGIYFGHISYSVYLFHLPLAMIVKPKLAGFGIPLQLVVFVALLVCLTTVIYLYIEKPILAARPKYVDREPRRPVGSILEPPRSRIATIALVIVGCVAGYYCFASYQGNHVRTFYLTLLTATAVMHVVANRIRIRGLASISLTMVFIALLLPAADYIFQNVHSPGKSQSIKAVKPAYSFRSAKADPQAFHAWWEYYVSEWTKAGGQRAIEKPDPKGLLPFVLIPNSTGRFFDSVIRINSLGFLGAEIDRDKGDRFRIFALGESPTFGPTLRPDDHNWPEFLQDLINTRLMCDRTIEVVNGATEAYTLADNIERLRRDIVPLRPDLLISYHGYNGLSGLFGSAAFSDAGHPPRRELGPSPILTEIAYRARLAIFQFELNRRQVRPIYTEDQVMKSKYADSYRRLLQIAHDNSFGVVLSSSSMAVNGSSPREVKNFYGSVFQNIDETIIRNKAHNEIVKKLAETEKVPFIDTAPQLDGFWDNDFYYDLVHFTQAGTKRMAQTMFDGLSGVLRNDPRLRCTETRKSGVVTK